MSSARCLNWSRPPPGRHPVLRKQVSCIEPSVNTAGPTTTTATAVTVTDGRRCDHFCQFLVTGAIIHKDRFQNYHTYHQAHRGGGSASSSAASIVGGQQQQRRARPASASSGGGGGGGGFSSPAPTGSDQERTRAANRRANLLCKQLSLDQSILVAATTTAAAAAGMAAVATATGPSVPSAEPPEAGGWTFGRKPRAGVAASGGPLKSDMMDAGTVGKKGLKSGKDSRINIKIFLGQTVQQQDSSDTGVSDTEGPSIVPPGRSGGLPLQKSDSTPAMSMLLGGNSSSSGGTAGSASQSASGGAGGTSAAPVSGAISGRNSSLAQRRAQFQANRQNSEAHDRRHPPLVRAMSAPIRPADPDTSKFLQSKKKSRRKKALREKDEYNICEEDEYSDDGGGGGGGVLGLPNGAGGAKSSLVATFPLRSRSVLGGACDIETLVSLLSSGGSDSEKEQESAAGTAAQQNSDCPLPTGPVPSSYRQPAAFSSTVGHLKGPRAPMLKKAGKSVSFQESDLKPVPATAGLNRDYRKPGAFQSAVAANRMRRTQQLVHTLNAFQLKDRAEQETDTGEDTVHDRTEGDKYGTTGQPTAVTTTKAASGKTEAKSAHGNASGAATNGASDLETPKEQECYRLFLKMSRKGLSVSYDTILRGMLTPTELRVLQKKKSLQRADTIDEHGIDGVFAPEAGIGGPENGIPPEVPKATVEHMKRELECDGPTIHEEPTAAAVTAEETKDEKEEMDHCPDGESTLP
ncbi:mucin-19 [Anopheles bellator]|uniref:mucin-19 n=1 Tax=Anopheles bellator TaxID=139047 RepID=UPI002648A3D3|nr:mucin-19 [Anopheles bellator]